VRRSRFPVPLACSLSPEALEERQRWLAEVNRQAIARRGTPTGLVIRFRRDEQLEAGVARLIAAEARCCPFLTLTVRPIDGFLELEVRGQAEARPIIDEMFGASDAA
jgi:MerR family copper efflux transcriptional regulator